MGCEAKIDGYERRTDPALRRQAAAFNRNGVLLTLRQVGLVSETGWSLCRSNSGAVAVDSTWLD